MGTAASPIAPHTHSAHWKPPVRATGVDVPASVSVVKRDAVIVDATATPIAPPIC